MAPPSDQQDEHWFPPVPARHESAELGAPSPATLELDLAAHWIAASLARDRAQLWLEAHRWPPAQTEELVLAVSEAVSNSVEHGYLVPPESLDHPGVVQVRGHIVASEGGHRHAVLTVTDKGSWKIPADDPERGMGLMIMRACTDVMDVSGSIDGTRVEFVSRVVPPPG